MSNILPNPFEGISELFQQRDSIVEAAADLIAEIHSQKRVDLISQLRTVESDNQTAIAPETSVNVPTEATSDHATDNVVSLDEYRAQVEQEAVESADTASHIERLTGTG